MYERIKKIGKGTFGWVYLVKKDDKYFAMKQVPFKPEDPTP